MFGITPPECPVCGALYGNEEKHQQFHTGLAAVWQKTFSMSDEDAAAIMGCTTAQYRERMDALAATGEQMMRDREARD